MSVKEYFVVQPYEQNEDGYIFPMDAIQARDAVQARHIARSMNCAGAVAFSRACDPDLGEYEDAVILLVVGRVPAEEAEAA